MGDFSRQDLKRNELENLIFKTIDWAKQNRQLFSGLSGTIVIVLGLTIFILARYHTTRARAEDKLAYAQANFYQGKVEEGVKIFDEIINQYSGTAGDYKARLYKTSYLFEMKKNAEAEETILPVAQKGRPKVIVPLAVSMLGAIRENAGKYKEAIATYNNFLDTYPEHFLAPKVYESLARVYEVTGSTQEARNTYEKLSTLYPASGWAQRAQEHILMISNSSQRPEKKIKLP